MELKNRVDELESTIEKVSQKLNTLSKRRENDKYITLRALAALWDVSYKTIYARMHARLEPQKDYFTKSGRVYIDKNSVDILRYGRSW